MRTWFSIAAALSAVSVASAFAPAAFLSQKARQSTNLCISSFDKTTETTDDRVLDPEKNIQSYLKKPENGIYARRNLDGSVLVSGLVKREGDRMDQDMFDLLNAFESSFEWTKIVAFVDDEKYAKKKLLSRKARYSGLLDMLDFSQADAPNALPTAAQVDSLGVTNWVAYIEDNHLEQLKKIADVCAASGGTLKNVAVLMVNAFNLDPVKTKAIEDKFAEKKSVKYTIVSVGKVGDYAEGTYAYAFEPLESEDSVLPEEAEFSRALSYRLITDMLQLEAGASKAYAFAEIYDTEATEAKLIKGLRAGGFNHAEEVEHMIKLGPQAYAAAIEEYKKSPYYQGAGYSGKNWWLAPEFQAKSIERTTAEDAKKEEQAKVDSKQAEIEKIAKEWATREFYRESLVGSTELSENEYVKSVWDRAMSEGELKYRQMHGGSISDEDDSEGYETFEEKQKRKEENMLKQAKAELAEVLTADDKPNDDDDDKKDD